MAINVTNAGANFPLVAPETLSTGSASPATLTLGLTPAALQSPQLQALLASLNPSQPFAVAQQPLPFSQTAVLNPSEFATSLPTASNGLQGAIDSLSQTVDADQNTVNADMADPNTDPKKLAQDVQKLNQDIQNYQVMVNLQSTINSIITNLDNKVIDNMKLQG